MLLENIDDEGIANFFLINTKCNVLEGATASENGAKFMVQQVEEVAASQEDMPKLPSLGKPH